LSYSQVVSQVWNSLPTELRQSDSLAQFKRRLKTHLFGLWAKALCDIDFLYIGAIEIFLLTYLLTYTIS